MSFCEAGASRRSLPATTWWRCGNRWSTGFPPSPQLSREFAATPLGLMMVFNWFTQGSSFLATAGLNDVAPLGQSRLSRQGRIVAVGGVELEHLVVGIGLPQSVLPFHLLRLLLFLLLHERMSETPVMF
jgi:hypothetical protein